MIDLGTSLDLDKVYTAMKDGRTILAFEFDAAIECVVALTQKHLAQDLTMKSIESIEVEYLLEDGAMKGHHGFMDLVVLLKPAGGYTIVDWKTTGTLDRAWAERQQFSWQGPLYVAAFREIRKLDWDVPVDVEFRGITRGKTDGTRGQRKLVLEITKERLEATVRQYNSVRRNILHQIEGANAAGPWAMRMPSACFSYNRTCPYFLRCTTGKQQLGVPEFTTLSYSSMNTFMECNELWRQQRLDRDQNNELSSSSEADFGNCVHRGMAEIYRQVREAPEKFVRG